MVEFSKEHKKEVGQYFGEGVHKVKIDEVVFGMTDKDKEYAEFKLIGENGETGSARMWFTTDGAINYSFNAIRNIFIHNTVEKHRDKMREKFDALHNTEELAEFCKALRGKECWYSIVKTDQTYTDNYGNIRHNYDRNVYGYEPKIAPKTEAEKVADKVGGEVVDTPDDEFPF